MEQVTAEQTVTNVIEHEVARFDPFEARLAELKEKYAGLTIEGVEDRDGYEATRLAIAELRSIRTGTAKDKAVIKKPFLDACGQIEEKAKFIIASVEAIENPLQARKDEIDAEKEKIKAERKRQQDAALIERVSILTKIGAAFTGTSYDLEDVSYQLDAIREADSEIFNDIMLPKYQAIYDRHEAVRIAEEEKKKEEEARLQQEREAFEAKQREMQEKEEALRKQQQEFEFKQQEAAEKEKKMRFDSRSAELAILGLTNTPTFFVYPGSEIYVSHDTIMHSKDWENLVSAASVQIEAFKKKVADELEADVQRMEKERLEREEQIRQDAIAQEKLRQQQEDDRKKEEAAAMNDSDKWKAYVALIVAPPEMKSSRYRKIVAIAKEKLEEIKTLKA